MRGLAVVLGVGVLGCVLEPDDDAAVLEITGTHRAALDACDGELTCLRAANDALAAEVVDEIGSEAVVLRPLQQHREFGAALCGDGACEAELELLLGEMMEVYLEGQIATPPQPAAFAVCHETLHDAVGRATNDLEVTLAYLDFTTCVETLIAVFAARVDDDGMLTERAPEVADGTCILLTARGGEHLASDRVLRCQADWQIAMFDLVY